VLSDLELQAPQPAQSSLFFYDKQNRAQILQQQKPSTAAEAFQKIKTAFEQCEDRSHYDQMARDDQQRFARESQQHILRIQ
jgi:hypothetical protein